MHLFSDPTAMSALAWGLLIYCAFWGWGLLILVLLRIDRTPPLIFLSPAIGLSGFCLLGGILNLLGLVGPSLLNGLVYSGSLLLAAFTFWNIKKIRPKLLLFIPLIALILLRFAADGLDFHSNTHDDEHAYFVFPEKMLQTGGLGADPFSGRRLEASLGAQYLTQALVFSKFDFNYAAIFDPGTSTWILISALIAFLIALRVNPIFWIFLILICFQVEWPRANSTSLAGSSALQLGLICMAWLFLQGSISRRVFLILFPLMLAGLGSLRSNNLPFMFLFFLGTFLLQWMKTREKKETSYFLGVGVLVLVGMLPWMIAQFLSSGTFLYPAFGLGFHGTAWGEPISASSVLTQDLVFHALREISTSKYVLMILGFLGTACAFHFRYRERFLFAFMLGIAAIFSGYLIGIAAGGTHEVRYAFPFLLSAAVGVAAICLAPTQLHRLAPIATTVVIVALSAVWMRDWKLGSVISKFKWSQHQIQRGLDREHFKNFQPCRASLKQMQDSIPAGEIILTRLARPYLLDFRRNPAWIADYPGVASPPPGMPSFKGSEALAEYLQKQGIRYVAYDYFMEANFNAKGYAGRLLPTAHPWIRATAKYTIDFQKNVHDLAHTRKRIFDDGERYVLDLSTKEHTPRSKPKHFEYLPCQQ